MWWLWVVIALAFLALLIVALQRRGSAGDPSYRANRGNDEQLGGPSGLGGDAGVGF